MSREGININGPQMSLKHLRRFALDNTGRGELAHFDLPNGKRISMKIGWFTTGYTLYTFNNGLVSSRVIQEELAAHYIEGLLNESRKPNLGRWIIETNENLEDFYVVKQDDLPKVFKAVPRAEQFGAGYELAAKMPNETIKESRPKAIWSLEELGTLSFVDLMDLVKDGEIGPHVARGALLSAPRQFTGLTAPAPGSDYFLQCSPSLQAEEIRHLREACTSRLEIIESLSGLNSRRGSLLQQLISIMEIEDEDDAESALPRAVMSLKQWAVRLEQRRNELCAQIEAERNREMPARWEAENWVLLQRKTETCSLQADKLAAIQRALGDDTLRKDPIKLITDLRDKLEQTEQLRLNQCDTIQEAQAAVKSILGRYDGLHGLAAAIRSIATLRDLVAPEIDPDSQVEGKLTIDPKAPVEYMSADDAMITRAVREHAEQEARRRRS